MISSDENTVWSLKDYDGKKKVIVIHSFWGKGWGNNITNTVLCDKEK